MKETAAGKQLDKLLDLPKVAGHLTLHVPKIETTAGKQLDKLIDLPKSMKQLLASSCPNTRHLTLHGRTSQRTKPGRPSNPMTSLKEIHKKKLNFDGRQFSVQFL